MKSVRRVCYAGTYEREYPRNTLVIQALRDAGVRVEECHRPVFERARHKGGSPLATMAGMAFQLLLAYMRLIPDVGLRLLRCDALVVGYIGQIDMLVLGTLTRVAGKPVIFNPLVSLTDTLVEDRRQFTEGSVIARAIGVIDRLSLRLANVVLTDTTENARYLETQFGVSPEKVSVVHVGAPEDVFYPEAGTQQGDGLDVLFVGKFIPLHGVETILRAAAILQERRVPARIEMVGTGQDYEDARQLAANLGLENITWTDWIAFDDLGDRIRAADIVLGVFDDGPKAGRVIPNKVHHALACGVPVITRDSRPVREILVDGESIVLVPPADPEALASAIGNMQSAESRVAIGQAGYESWRSWGARTALAAQVRDAVRRLGAGR